MHVFLDDVRTNEECAAYMSSRMSNPEIYLNESWIIVRTFSDFITVVSKCYDVITDISFDNDLSLQHYGRRYHENYEMWLEDHGNDKGNGVACLNFTKMLYELLHKPLPNLYFHTMNQWALQRMNEIINLR